MTPDLFPSRAAAPAGAPADLAVTALPKLAAARDVLRTAARFRDAVRAAAASAPKWAAPPAVFLADRFAPVRSPEPPGFVAVVARRYPVEAAAWDRLPDLAADLEADLTAADVRRAGRAVRGFREAVAGLAADSPAVARLAGLLAIPDDDIVLVIHPEAGAGWRIRPTGVADVAQFHVLLAAKVPADLPGGARPSPAAVAAYRAGRPAPLDPPEATPRFQLFRPQALGPNGRLPDGVSGCGDWLWGTRPLAAVPAVDGERVVLLGRPVVASGWDAVPKFPGVPAALDVIQELSAPEVDDWLTDWCGAAPFRAAFRPAVVRAA
jgi:hypothetical protein